MASALEPGEVTMLGGLATDRMMTKFSMGYELT
jgi:hypothetical protein